MGLKTWTWNWGGTNSWYLELFPYLELKPVTGIISWPGMHSNSRISSTPEHIPVPGSGSLNALVIVIQFILQFLGTSTTALGGVACTSCSLTVFSLFLYCLFFHIHFFHLMQQTTKSEFAVFGFLESNTPRVICADGPMAFHRVSLAIFRSLILTQTAA